MKSFWALIQVDEEVTTFEKVHEICTEIENTINRVVQVTPADQSYPEN